MKVVHPKSDEQRSRLQDRVQTCVLFKAMDDSQLGDVIDAMFEMKVEAGQFIILRLNSYCGFLDSLIFYGMALIQRFFGFFS